MDLSAHLMHPEASFMLACWILARRDAPIPCESELRRHKIDWVMADIMILRQDHAGALYYAHYGSRIATHAGFNMTGRPVTEFKGALGQFFCEVYQRVMTRRQAVVTVHRLGNYNERPMWERAILPVLDDCGRVAIYVVNRVRKLATAFAHMSARARANGLVALQFRRDSRGAMIDATITGANAAALTMTGRRLDELLERSITECFTGVKRYALWERFLAVSDSRRETSFQLAYCCDSIDEVFDVRLAPFHDGVCIDFRPLGQQGVGPGDLFAPRLQPGA